MIAVLSVDRSGDLHLNEERVSQLQYVCSAEDRGGPARVSSSSRSTRGTYIHATRDECLWKSRSLMIVSRDKYWSCCWLPSIRAQVQSKPRLKYPHLWVKAFHPGSQPLSDPINCDALAKSCTRLTGREFVMP